MARAGEARRAEEGWRRGLGRRVLGAIVLGERSIVRGWRTFSGVSVVCIILEASLEVGVVASCCCFVGRKAQGAPSRKSTYVWFDWWLRPKTPFLFFSFLSVFLSLLTLGTVCWYQTGRSTPARCSPSGTFQVLLHPGAYERKSQDSLTGPNWL